MDGEGSPCWRRNCSPQTASVQRRHRSPPAGRSKGTLNRQNVQLQREVIALETELKIDDSDDPGLNVRCDLHWLTVLYVGGRPGLIDQLKAIVARRRGTLLSHDGGIEENPAALPGLISRADAAFFPVDCISHLAVGLIKKYCRDTHKPFVPLRTASAASFIAAVRNLNTFQNRRPSGN
jgi:hypothetical protein